MWTYLFKIFLFQVDINFYFYLRIEPIPVAHITKCVLKRSPTSQAKKEQERSKSIKLRLTKATTKFFQKKSIVKDETELDVIKNEFAAEELKRAAGKGVLIFFSVLWLVVIEHTPLSAFPKNWSNTLKQFFGESQRIVWVCLTILWGWRLKGYLDSSKWGFLINSKYHFEFWLSNFMPVFSFYTPREYQTFPENIKGFLVISGGIRDYPKHSELLP